MKDAEQVAASNASRLKIRLRHRVGRVREAGGRHMEWSEWQVTRGHRVIARFDFQEQARAFVEEAAAKHGSSDAEGHL